MFSVCHITPAHNGPISRLLSGWATTMDKLLNPKLALSAFLKDTLLKFLGQLLGQSRLFSKILGRIDTDF